MSFDIPTHLKREIQEYARSVHISTDEAVVRLVASGLREAKRETVDLSPITEEELRRLRELDPTFGLLADVPEEAIDRMAETIRLMKEEDFSFGR